MPAAAAAAAAVAAAGEGGVTLRPEASGPSRPPSSRLGLVARPPAARALRVNGLRLPTPDIRRRRQRQNSKLEIEFGFELQTRNRATELQTRNRTGVVACWRLLCCSGSRSRPPRRARVPGPASAGGGHVGQGLSRAAGTASSLPSSLQQGTACCSLCPAAG